MKISAPLALASLSIITQMFVVASAAADSSSLKSGTPAPTAPPPLEITAPITPSAAPSPFTKLPPFFKVGGTYILNGNEEDLVKVVELSDTGWIRVETKSGQTWVNTSSLTTVVEVTKDAASKSAMKEKADYILSDAIQIDQAIAAYAKKNNLPMNAPLKWEDIRKFLKPNTPVYNSGGKDVTGRPYVLGATVGDGVKISPETIKEFTPVIDDPGAYWGKFRS